MEKRFVAFLALAFAILMVNSVFIGIMNPPPPKGAAPLPARVADGQGAGADQGAGEADERPQPVGEVGAVEESPDQAAEVDGQQEAQEQAPPIVAPAANVPQEWVTLGSVDPESGYRMLLTLNNRGAAIERLELSSRRFSDVDDRSGYLGHLALVDAPGGGGLVRVVGPGTPAEASGLTPGDVITAVAGVAVDSTEAYQVELQKTKPGNEIELTVTRANGQAVTLPVDLIRRPLEVMRPEVENVVARRKTPAANIVDPASLLLTLDRVGDQELGDLDEINAELPGVDLLTANWEVDKTADDSVIFTHRLPRLGLMITKRYSLARVPADQLEDESYPAYDVDFEVVLTNLSDTAQQVAYRLDGATGLPIEGWWYGNKIGRKWGAIGLRDMAVQFDGAEVQMFGCSAIAAGNVEPMGQGASLMYAGIDAQYFSAILLPQKSALTDVWFSDVRALRIDPDPTQAAKRRLVNVTTRLISKSSNLEPGGELRHRFQFFAGPKRPALLERYGQRNAEGLQKYSLAPLVYYGWFSPVAGVMLWVLHSFYAVVGNYGIAIVMLTVMVRGMMFPLSRKQAKNMAKMQELGPEMKKLTEKYKDREKRARAQQELWRKHNVHPLGGCLPMFIQLPIFVGLYRSLMVDVELRQAPLLSPAIRWCSNLSAPDMLFDWSAFMPDFITSGEGILGLGPYLNILPLVTVVLFLWQQKMFMPPPADEKAEMQQKIMKYMMIFMAVLFFKVASGLCLYFVVSTLWGIAERKMLPKPPSAATPAASTTKPPPTKASANGNTSSGKKKGKHKQKQKRR